MHMCEYRIFASYLTEVLVKNVESLSSSMNMFYEYKLSAEDFDTFVKFSVLNSMINLQYRK